MQKITENDVANVESIVVLNSFCFCGWVWNSCWHPQAELGCETRSSLFELRMLLNTFSPYEGKLTTTQTPGSDSGSREMSPPIVRAISLAE